MVLGTDLGTIGTVGSTTDRLKETLDLVTSGEMIATGTATEEKDSGVNVIMSIQTGIVNESEETTDIYITVTKLIGRWPGRVV